MLKLKCKSLRFDGGFFKHYAAGILGAFPRLRLANMYTINCASPAKKSSENLLL